MIDAAFQALRTPDVAWTKLALNNPRGLWWKAAGSSALKQIISVLQIRLKPLGVMVWLDEDYRDDSLPRNIIVFHSDKTELIPLRFRDRMVLVGGRPVATSHDGGAILLALTIVDAVQSAVAEISKPANNKETT